MIGNKSKFDGCQVFDGRNEYRAHEDGFSEAVAPGSAGDYRLENTVFMGGSQGYSSV